jgi:YD repeat-containing protein
VIFADSSRSSISYRRLRALPSGNTERSNYELSSSYYAVRITNSSGQSNEYVYDENKKLREVVDANGHSQTYFYHLRNQPGGGRLGEVLNSDGTSSRYIYDRFGNLVKSINSRGHESIYSYDNNGLLVHQQLADGSSIHSVYDVHGNCLSISDSRGRVEMEYDTYNRLTSITYPNSRSIHYKYNNASQIIQINSDGFIVNYSYDEFSRLIKVGDDTGSNSVYYEYDSADRIVRKLNANGTSTAYGYCDCGSVNSITNYSPTGSINSKYTYSYNELGQRTSMSTVDGLWLYSYDSLGQLVSISSPEGKVVLYQYDAAGNRVAALDGNDAFSYQSNNLNQYSVVGKTNFYYDADGNLIKKSTGDSEVLYEYDSSNRLIHVSSNQGTEAYQYDALGHRSAKIVNGIRTEFLVDPLGYSDIMAEYNADGSIRARYMYGHGLLAQMNFTNNTSFYDLLKWTFYAQNIFMDYCTQIFYG